MNGSYPGGPGAPPGGSPYPGDSGGGAYPGAPGENRGGSYPGDPTGGGAPYPGGGGSYPGGPNVGGDSYPGGPNAGGGPYPGAQGSGGGFYGNSGPPSGPPYPGGDAYPDLGRPEQPPYGPERAYGAPPPQYGPPSGPAPYPQGGPPYPQGGAPYPQGPAPQYNQGPSPYPSYQPPPLPHNGPPPGSNYIPPGPPPPQQPGGHGLPPPGPGMNNMHMMHGPTPYAGGVPSIQNQGTGMTAEGGRKKALICGCNYRGSPSELGGCINDAKCMRYLLISKFGFRSEDITMLTDDQSHPGAWPTKQNMIANMQRLVGDARPGDSLVFHYSGHGSQTQDWQGEEEDGYNETLCPCDFKQAGMIVDNELNRLLVNPLPPGVRLHAIIDACHSGSMLDLECRAEFKGGRANWQNEYRRRPKVYKGTRGGEAIQFGAARDSQTAADTAKLSGTVSTGAATFSFIQAVERAGTRISYGQLLMEMDATLAGMGRRGPSSGSSGGGAFGMGGLLNSLLGDVGGGGGGGGGYKGQTPVLSSNMPFDLSRLVHI